VVEQIEESVRENREEDQRKEELSEGKTQKHVRYKSGFDTNESWKLDQPLTWRKSEDKLQTV